MADYSFSNLSSMEFEFLCRDLLQKDLNIPLESFGSGPDKGIDLRYTGNGELIIQCKKYATFSSLKTNLKKEVKNLLTLKPRRYIIATSVSLVPGQKDQVMKMFSPYISDPVDIIGREDLNNLLQQYPEIEKANYKLWLSSSVVLERILYSKTLNDSKFVLNDIEQKIKYYVQNNSYSEAVEILHQEHYVVISGNPGIGKTTLAEFLSYSLLAENQAEFINISNNVDEAFGLIKGEGFQIFLFDDFLGSTFLDNSFKRNEDKQLLRLIRTVRTSKNLRLIMTTREYILNQAKTKFEALAEHSFAKCIIDLSSYTTEIRAKILYNHLYFNDVPSSYFNELIDKNHLFQIIEHRNYSPRIIDYITSDGRWKAYPAAEFGRSIVGYFDKPLKIWELPFENHISPLSRIMLYCLLACGSEATGDDLYKQMLSYNSTANQGKVIELDEQLFKRSLKELDNSFIITYRSKKKLKIKFQNPSIQDFLIEHVDRYDSVKEQIIKSAIFLRPLLNLFHGEYTLWSTGKLLINEKIEKKLRKKIITDYDRLRLSPLSTSENNNNHDQSQLAKASLIFGTFSPKREDKLFRFIRKQFLKILYSQDFSQRNLADYLEFLILFIEDPHDVNIVIILQNLCPLIEEAEDLNVLYEIRRRFSEQYDIFLEDEDQLLDIFPRVIARISQVNHYDFDECHKAIDLLLEITENFKIDTSDARAEIAEMANQYAEHLSNMEAASRLEPKQQPEYVRTNRIIKIAVAQKSEKRKITDIFRSFDQKE